MVTGFPTYLGQFTVQAQIKSLDLSPTYSFLLGFDEHIAKSPLLTSIILTAVQTGALAMLPGANSVAEKSTAFHRNKSSSSFNQKGDSGKVICKTISEMDDLAGRLGHKLPDKDRTQKVPHQL